MSRLSEIIPIVILVLLMTIATVRRRGRPGSRLRPGTMIGLPDRRATASGKLLPLPGDVGLVAARELRERLRGRAFRVGTLLILAVIAAAIVIPAVRGDRASVQRVGVVGVLSAPLKAGLVADATAAGTTVTLVSEASRPTAEADLRGGRIDIAVIESSEVVTDKPATANRTSATAQLADAVARTLGTAQAVQTAGLTSEQAAALAAARPLPVASLQPAGPGSTQRDTSLVGLLLVFFLLTQYNAWTLLGVVEEKSSRVVEVLLAAVPPSRLLAGKVLGIGLAVFLQAGLAVVVALSLAHRLTPTCCTGPRLPASPRRSPGWCSAMPSTRGSTPPQDRWPAVRTRCSRWPSRSGCR